MTLTRQGFLWAVVALLGIAVTVALTWSVSRLAGQRIGLSYTPLSAIHRLAPRHEARLERGPRAKSAARRASRHAKLSPAPAGGATVAPSTSAPPAIRPTAAPAGPAPAPASPSAPSAPSTSRTSTPTAGSGSSSGGNHSDDTGGGRSGAGGSGSSHRDD